MVNTGLNAETLVQSANLLNSMLSNHFTVMMKVWQFHWNVVGSSFGSYHAALEGLYTTQQKRVDMIAERVRSLGEKPLTSLRSILAKSTITEIESYDYHDTTVMWAVINSDWDSLIRQIRDIHQLISSEDLATLNMLEGLIDEMEKEAWMIRSYTE